MVTKSSPSPLEKSSTTQSVPTLIRKALLRAGLSENDIPHFLTWAFNGPIPDTFWQLCITWNQKFGHKFWLNLTQANSASELSNLFFQMGQLYTSLHPATTPRN
ncbi:MAG: hypothetical protein HYX48_01705 [Chlamydiales bacterium]|nr:hypothetical protein [Chlamydiales bacterium]